MNKFRIQEISFHERSVNLRLPFRFGVATLTKCPQVHVLVRIQFPNGKEVEGCSAEMMVPKWFDKNIELSNEENIDQLRFALKTTRDAYLQDRLFKCSWQHFIQNYDQVISICGGNGINPLAASYGPALIDRALIDALCHHLNVSFYECMKKNLVDIDLRSHKKVNDLADFDLNRFLSNLTPSVKIAARHTVGLIDPIFRSELTQDMPKDGLPVCLEDIVQFYGHTHYKLKLSGDSEVDIHRLEKIANVICDSAQVITLDGNEQYSDVSKFEMFFEKFKTTHALEALFQKTLFVEQPIRREQTLSNNVSEISRFLPLLVDESDGDLDTFISAIKLGYTGISSKSCKGVYKSIINAARCVQMRELTGIAYFQSGEDLTMQAGVALQQDLALVSLLGLSHVERNGHHYVNGMSAISQKEQEEFHTSYPSLYESSNEVVRLKIKQGQLDLTSLDCKGFATVHERAQIDWDSMNLVY